jgi:hypothetical protein
MAPSGSRRVRTTSTRRTSGPPVRRRTGSCGPASTGTVACRRSRARGSSTSCRGGAPLRGRGRRSSGGCTQTPHISRLLEPYLNHGPRLRPVAGCPECRHLQAFRSTERAGFEPAMEFDPHTRLAGECLQPLGHLSRWEMASLEARGRRRASGPPRPTVPARTRAPGRPVSIEAPRPGGVAERLNAPVLKTGMGESPSRVRIPPPPLRPAAVPSRAGARRRARRARPSDPLFILRRHELAPASPRRF